MSRERLYHSHIVGDWYEIDSNSDGMCGWVGCENEVTTEYVRYHWSVTGKCQSQSEARERAKQDLAAGRDDDRLAQSGHDNQWTPSAVRSALRPAAPVPESSLSAPCHDGTDTGGLKSRNR